MSKFSDILKKRKAKSSSDPGNDAEKIPLALTSPKRITWKHRVVFIASLLLLAFIIIMIASAFSNPVTKTKKNMQNALVISASDLISAYSDADNADILYKNKYIKVSGVKWLGYSADGHQKFHVWNGAENVNLHSPIFDISCAFPNTKYYKDLSPYYGSVFDITVVGKCVGVSDGHIQMVDCILVTDIE